MCLGGLCGYRVVWLFWLLRFGGLLACCWVCSLFAAITVAVVWLCVVDCCSLCFVAGIVGGVLYCIGWFTLYLIVLDNCCFVFICGFTCVVGCCLMVGLCLFDVVEFCCVCGC